MACILKTIQIWIVSNLRMLLKPWMGGTTLFIIYITIHLLRVNSKPPRNLQKSPDIKISKNWISSQKLIWLVVGKEWKQKYDGNLSCDSIKYLVCADILPDIKVINCWLTNPFRCKFLNQRRNKRRVKCEERKDHAVKAYKILQGKLWISV